MFRRSRQNSNNTTPTPAATEQADPIRVLNDLLAKPSVDGVLENALTYAASLLGGNVKGYGIVRRGQDRIAGVLGYPRSLIGQNLSGPWADMRARILSDGSHELYAANSVELHRTLDAAGMRNVPLTLVVPISDRGRNSGALVLDRTNSDGITPMQQEAVARWASAIAPLIGILDSRREWQQTARQVTAAVVEAVESQEFDALGHAQAVAETAVRMGRGMGLVDRELEELWFAATLHDLGKIHGIAGHPLIGANFLHGVPHLAEAQKAIKHHHERWDGQGEPDKLVGNDIPLYARMLAVANAYVRLGSVRQVQAQAGKGLDPEMVELLAKVVK